MHNAQRDKRQQHSSSTVHLSSTVLFVLQSFLQYCCVLFTLLWFHFFLLIALIRQGWSSMQNNSIF